MPAKKTSATQGASAKSAASTTGAAATRPTARASTPSERAPTKAATTKAATTKPATTKPATANSTITKTAATAAAKKAAANSASSNRAVDAQAGDTRPTAASAAPAKTAPAKAARKASPSVRALATQLKVAEDEAPWTTAELTEVREQLVELIGLNRTEVQHGEVELDSLMRGPGTGAGDDQADAGAKTFEREHEIAIVNNTRDVLEQTEHALERLDAGTYGICENCGKPIGKLRLQARPRATLCLSCQNKQARH